MSENRLIGRIVNKHDIQANWEKATNFTPMLGEIIVYDVDENFAYERFKIGDGQQNVNALPFADAATLTEAKAYTDAELSAALISSQADWNENDSTSPAYVKNRTHWVEGEDVVVLQETTVTTADDDGCIFAVLPPLSEQCIAGETYTVVFNEAQYECVAWDAIGGVCVGNGDIEGMPYYSGLGNGEPFLFHFYTNSTPEVLTNSIGTYTISIFKDGSIVHQLDPKYIPTATEDQLVSLLMEIDAFPAMTDSNGAVFTHNDAILLI